MARSKAIKVAAVIGAEGVTQALKVTISAGGERVAMNVYGLDPAQLMAGLDNKFQAQQAQHVKVTIGDMARDVVLNRATPGAALRTVRRELAELITSA